MKIEIKVVEEVEMTQEMIIRYLEFAKAWSFTQIPEVKSSFWAHHRKGYNPRRLAPEKGDDALTTLLKIFRIEDKEEGGNAWDHAVRYAALVRKIQQYSEPQEGEESGD